MAARITAQPAASSAAPDRVVVSAQQNLGVIVAPKHSRQIAEV
jgi:hypothetical protein